LSPRRRPNPDSRWRLNRQCSALLQVVILAVVGLVTATVARAQQNPATDTSPVTIEKRPYEDRVMEGLQSPDAADEVVAEYDPQGWPRGISLQLTRNFQTSQNASASSGNLRTDTQGIQIDAFLEAPNFGALSIHALSLGGRGSTGLTSWSIRQTGLPFDGGWRADNALGTTNLVVPEMSRRNSRLTLPSPQVLGGSTIWRNAGTNGLMLGASAGEPGRFEGFPQSRFVGLGGRVSSAFAQATFGQWTGAAAFAQGNSITPEVAPAAVGDEGTRISPSAVYLSMVNGAAFSGVDLQMSAISSRSAGIDSTGLWADATWRDGGNRHQASVFRFNDGLRWIDRPLASDLQGASYRYDYTSLRWDLSTNVESFSSVSGKNPSGWYGSASARHLLSAGVSTGGGLAARSFGVTGESLFGYLQWQNSLGVSRLQVDASATQNGEKRQALTVDHSFYTESGLSLSSSLSLERLQPKAASTDEQRLRATAGIFSINGRTSLSNSVSVQGSFRARNVRGTVSDAGTSLSANLGVDWQISRDWSLGASLYVNRGAFIEAIAIDSPLVVPEILRVRPTDRGVFLTLRYGMRAGTPSMPLGGAPGSGSGRIEGSVFLDANGNGIRDGNENGAANVLVLLDGKFSTRTDALGSFEFSSVVAGPHSLFVVQDNLPLPWSLDTDLKISAPVSTRDVTRIDIGAKRSR
ncbi:MAG: hypothetical protein ABI583_05540, partial [Betaproteobacteria bacterium]